MNTTASNLITNFVVLLGPLLIVRVFLHGLIRIPFAPALEDGLFILNFTFPFIRHAQSVLVAVEEVESELNLSFIIRAQ